MERLRTDHIQSMRLRQRGQSLIEVLIAVAVGGVLIGGAAALVALLLQSGTQTKFYQAAALAGQDLMDRVAVFAEADWHNVQSLGHTNNDLCGGAGMDCYYFLKDSNPADGVFEISDLNKEETVNLDGVDYMRSFIVASTSRDINGDIGQGDDDPSTKKITVNVTWIEGSGGSIQLAQFITRSSNFLFHQTDWSGGVAAGNPVVNRFSIGNTFSSESGTEFSAEPGCVKISGFSETCP